MTEYIFSEQEFEDDVFHAASFVAKHRRVTSLDSLRDQLHAYCGALKDQLYSIINRDYKDFITIATKVCCTQLSTLCVTLIYYTRTCFISPPQLDGVDMRVEHLRKPLVDLRLDLANLHDGMVASMRTIEDKLRHREEVVSRRRTLEAMMACMEKLDLAEEIVLLPNQGGGGSGAAGGGAARGPKRRDLLRCVSSLRRLSSTVYPAHSITHSIRARSLARSHGMAAYTSISRDVFDCSELERAAHSVAQAKRYLASLHPASTVSGGGGSGSKPGAALVPPQPLAQRVTRLEEQLLQRIRARIVAIFSSCSAVAQAVPLDADANSSSCDKPSSSSGLVDGTASENTFPARAFAHCLRAVVALSRGDIAEEAVADTVTRPLAKNMLTQGRVDGTGGRGSYAGLQEALEGLATSVFHAVALPRKVCNDTFPQHTAGEVAPVDLMVNGVWLPIAALLAERFPGMFSVGIASTMARCYSAVSRFASILEQREQLASSAAASATIASPSSFKQAVDKFNQNWKLDLYLQLRTQEITGRLDVACNLVHEHGLVTKVAEAVYADSEGAGGTGCVATLNQKDLHGAREAARLNVKLPVSEVFLTELVTCVHPSAALSAVAADLFSLALRLVVRYEAFAAIAAETPTPSFPKSAMAALLHQLQANASAAAANKEAAAAAAVAAGGKDGVQPAAASSGAALALKAVGTLPMAAPASIDDLMLLTADLAVVAGWLTGPFVGLVENVIRADGAARIVALALGTQESAVMRALALQGERLLGARVAVWERVCALMAGDCKKGLLAVRAIAAKYRMTNKPPPDAPSPYVDAVLQPLRHFLDRHGELLASFRVAATSGDSSSAANFIARVLDDVTTAFLQQVQGLLETVKQMDSALQRRSKLRTAGAAGGGASGSSMADSDKISLQLYLDVKAYGGAVCALGFLTTANQCIDEPDDAFTALCTALPSFATLHAEVQGFEKLLLEKEEGR